VEGSGSYGDIIVAVTWYENLNLKNPPLELFTGSIY
jgi:hypothetical protein